MVMTDTARKIPPEFPNKAVDETVVGRVATPDECADVVVFLCSDRACHVTGEVIKLDGGRLLAWIGETVAEDEIKIGMDIQVVPQIFEEMEGIKVYYSLEKPGTGREGEGAGKCAVLDRRPA
jgi:hypothetical protein